MSYYDCLYVKNKSKAHGKTIELIIFVCFDEANMRN